MLLSKRKRRLIFRRWTRCAPWRLGRQIGVRKHVTVLQWHATKSINLMPPFFPPQDPRQPGLQQHCHSGGSQEKRLFAKPGETALEEQHHSPTELPAAAHSRHERIAAGQCPLLRLCVGTEISLHIAHKRPKPKVQFYATATVRNIPNEKGFARCCLPPHRALPKGGLCTDVQYIYIYIFFL